MADDLDPTLQALFAQDAGSLDGGDFTARVVARTRKFRYLVIGGCAALALLTALVLWLFAVPRDLAWLVVQALATPIVDLGEGWIGWIMAPVNNVGGLLALVVKLLWTLRARARSAFRR